MKTRNVLLLVAILLMMNSTKASAQIDVSGLSARTGVIRTLNPSHQSISESRWTFYPEAGIGGAFFAPSLSWEVSWGYWYDGGVDDANYADRSHIIGVRFSFLPQVVAPHFLIPVKLSAGVAEHFIYRENVGRHQWVETASSPTPWRRDGPFQSTTLFAGLGLSVSLSSSLRLEAEALEHFPLADEHLIDYEQEYRLAFTLGVAYTW